MRSVTYIPEHLRLWKYPSNYFGASWPEFYPVIGHHRDSDLLTESNFETVRKALKAEDAAFGDGLWTRSEKQPEVVIVRESSSLVGWVEWIGVREDAEEKLRLADELAGRMEDYPVLDEDDFSQREEEEDAHMVEFLGSYTDENREWRQAKIAALREELEK